jgi:hypothetical protein
MRGAPAKVQREHVLVVARQENERNAARLENCGGGKTEGVAEPHIQHGAVEGLFPGYAAGLLQTTDATNGLDAGVA